MDTNTFNKHASLLGEYQIGPASLEHARGIHQMYIAIDQADQLSWAGSLDEVELDFKDTNSNPETDTILALAPDGEVAGLGWVFVNQAAERERRAFLWGCVHPAHRRRGLGTLILGWLEMRGSERLASYQDNLPHILKVPCPDHLQDRIALLTKHGFEPVRYFNRMRRNLAEPIPHKLIPEGIRICKWSPELDDATRITINTAFRDHWGSEPASPETWKHHHSDSSTFRPDLTLIALHEDQVVGACTARVFAEDNARAGIQEGWIGSLGVIREWRGRGLASYLLVASMQMFKDEGFDYAGLGVDSDNLTGALRLYERVGFYTIERSGTWSKPPLER